MVPSCRWTASSIISKARSMIACTSSGSSRSEIVVKPHTSTNITVTRLRSPSSALFEVRIFSARCFGVYACGDEYFESSEVASSLGPAATGAAVDAVAAGSTAVAGGVAAASRTPHSWQNLFVGGLDAWHEGQTDWSRAPHSPQNLTLAAFSCRH